MNYAVIMAGGSGKRLWPLSRQKKPKQVLKLIDGQTLLRKCFDRTKNIFDIQNIFVLTNADYVDVVRENLYELHSNNIIAEPVMRDTASAISLAASVLYKQDKDATMAVVTADQILEPVEAFKEAARSALSFVKENPDSLITFGIKLTFPSTQLGYIKFGPKQNSAGNPVYKIDSFREKPDIATAKHYLDDGNYFWNSGLFVWKCETILTYLNKFLPQNITILEKLSSAWRTPRWDAALMEFFPRLEKISIDYAAMEKADNVYGIELNCRWLDLGSFAALRDIIKPDVFGNTIVSKHKELLDSNDNIVITEDDGHLLALIGVENMIVVHSKDATLVCPVSQAERLKELLDKLTTTNQELFLYRQSRLFCVSGFAYTHEPILRDVG